MEGVLELLHPRGTVGRGTYALAGAIGFAIKHNLDRLIASWVFHRPWSLFNYWVPVRDVVQITLLPPADARFLATMLAMALPFVLVGVVLTLKRLRSAHLPSGLLVLFFIPFLNLLFFLILCLWPERDLPEAENAQSWGWSLAKIVPESALGSAGVSVLVTVPLGFGLAFLGTHWLNNYGWGLFVAGPFAMGFMAAMLHGVRTPRGAGACISVACLSVAILGAALLAFAFEGVICLIMAAPLALVPAILGGVCAHFVQSWPRSHKRSPAFLSIALAFVPGVQWVEHAAGPAPAVFEVKSSIIVQGPPEKVWQQAVTFNEIPAPTEWMFRAGIAYPIRAEIVGSGPGAERHCVFSTGAFVEPIEVWEEPYRLKFSVTSNPAPLEEWTPYPHIDPPHLHGFMVSNGGQFLLTPLPGGRTQVEGTTWYRHGLWPKAYWRLWSDAIIHRIHMRVLRHIQAEVEHANS
jgi:hypothetical protein